MTATGKYPFHFQSSQGLIDGFGNILFCKSALAIIKPHDLCVDDTTLMAQTAVANDLL